MSGNNLTMKAFKEKVFAKGFGEFVRTVPATGDDAPYIGFIKTTQGESKVPHGNKTVFEVLTSGEEITEEEYNNAELTALNDF